MPQQSRSIAYLIVSHSSTNYLANLLSYIYNKEDKFLIHVDEKAPEATHVYCSKVAELFENVFLLGSELCSWGGFSQVRITLRGIRAASDLFGASWDHFVLLSEAHLPLTSASDIRQSLIRGKSYIHHVFYSDLTDNARADIDHRFEFRYEELRGVGMFPGPSLKRPQWFLDRLVTGSNWIALSKPHCELLLRREDDVHIMSNFETSLQPDETFFQTTLLGFGLGAFFETENENLTFVAYEHLTDNSHLIFSEANFFEARSRGYRFVRKRPNSLPDAVISALSPQKCNIFDDLWLDCKKSAFDAVEDNLSRDARVLLVKKVQSIYENANITDLSAEWLVGSPRLFLQIRHPSFPKNVYIGIISENLSEYKVFLCNLDEFKGIWRNEVSGHSTATLKVRAHDVFLRQEVLNWQKNLEANNPFIHYNDLESAIEEAVQFLMRFEAL